MVIFSKGGFTLVELSIVLVIIGLLIGGILVGQNLIDSVRLNRQVNQLQQFDAAVVTFRTKYKCLVSDCISFGGNNNGVLNRITSSNGIDRFQGEIANFWNVLNPIQYPKYWPEAAKGLVILSGEDKNTPAAIFGAKQSFWMASSMSTNGITGQYADTTNKEAYYVHLSKTQSDTVLSSGGGNFASSNATNSAATPQELAALDRKLDDGAANSGILLSGDMDGTIAKGLSKAPNAQCSVGQDYVLSTSTYACTSIVRVGGYVGLPQ